MVKYLSLTNILFIIFALSCSNKSETITKSYKLFVLDTIVETGITTSSQETHFDRVPFDVYGGCVYYLWFDERNNLSVSRYMLTDRKVSSVYVSYPNDIDLKTSLIWDISVNKDFFLILSADAVVVFKFIGIDTLEFLQSISLTEPFTKIVLNKESPYKLFLCRCYNYKRPDSNFAKVKISVVDFPSLQEEKHISPEFDAIEMSHFFPNLWYDVNPSGNLIAFANTLKYKIFIYDSNLTSKFTFYTAKSNWKKLELDLKKVDENKPAKEIIKLLEPYVKKGFSRIRKIHFIDDSTLIVFYHSDAKVRGIGFFDYYDIWRIGRDTSKIIFENSTDVLTPNSEIIEKQNFPLFGISNNLKFDNGYAVSLGIFASYDVIFNEKISYQQLLRTNLEKYYENNIPTFQLFVYKVSMY